MTYEEIISRVADDNSLSRQFVDRVWKGYWKAIRQHMSSLPLKEDLTDEEFLKLRPNVNIPSIGKFYVTLGRYKKVKKKFKTIEERKKQNGTTH